MQWRWNTLGYTYSEISQLSLTYLILALTSDIYACPFFSERRVEGQDDQTEVTESKISAQDDNIGKGQGCAVMYKTLRDEWAMSPWWALLRLLSWCPNIRWSHSDILEDQAPICNDFDLKIVVLVMVTRVPCPIAISCWPINFHLFKVLTILCWFFVTKLTQICIF